MSPSNIQFDPGLTERYSGRLRKTLNPDGSFNVQRQGTRLKDAGWFLYFMNLGWPSFLLQMPLIYLLVISAFAALYLWAGVENLQGGRSATTIEAVSTAFFFSVQTFTTVGYGHIAPASLVANFVAAAEALCGILSLAIATGLIYARFSRPTAHLAFSVNALIAPFAGGEALMFRLANRRPNVLLELEASLLLMTVELVDGERKRRFVQLELERRKVYFLPLTWTVVHPIDEKSPLRGKTREDLEGEQAEFLVLIKAFDDTFSQTVHARHSYIPPDLVWGARFQPAFQFNEHGDMVLDMAKLDLSAPAEIRRQLP